MRREVTEFKILLTQTSDDELSLAEISGDVKVANRWKS